MQDLLIFSSSMPISNSNWLATIKLIIKIEMQVDVETSKIL